MNTKKEYPVQKTEAEWKEQLGEERYRVLRKKGTERAHTGKYNLHFEDGTYRCGACNSQLFESDSKFESSCGWPSFSDAIDGAIEYVEDKSFGMTRTEILCANCGSHLGHVFNDGPTPSGERFCVNSASVDFDNE
ncbi:MAG TPA: peptide-methionine (R)-S-oxide reductase [Leeuwenhoekiella sp.]|nr:peptide-methionine (R)-S-oxide reductase [Leeuwenhoekiella sp.]